MKKYQPISKYIRIVQSDTFKNIEYKVSIGLELIDEVYILVSKVQVIKNNKLINASPSYPMDSNDFENINKTIEELLLERNNNATNLADEYMNSLKD